MTRIYQVEFEAWDEETKTWHPNVERVKVACGEGARAAIALAEKEINEDYRADYRAMNVCLLASDE